ncbi:MAG: hypothetical protein HDS95_00705 [Bacteroidales bacterium]|nr:hypothetical protein [Bacteroidales bacterium]MBD5287995.1 hypothetical protein [Bacteroides sp.]MBD5386912.1 hypothetical protein [bacterium]
MKCPLKKEDRLPLCINVGLHVAAITLLATAMHKLCRIHKGLRDIRKGREEIEKGKKEIL